MVDLVVAPRFAAVVGPDDMRHIPVVHSDTGPGGIPGAGVNLLHGRPFAPAVIGVENIPVGTGAALHPGHVDASLGIFGQLGPLGVHCGVVNSGFRSPSSQGAFSVEVTQSALR